MRQKLITYVDLLFAGAPNSGEIRQEILQNTLDRYDDLIKQGKSPECAYRIAISGIGDVNELLSGNSSQYSKATQSENVGSPKDDDNLFKQILRATAIFLYIISPIPLLILSSIHDIFGINVGDLSVIGFCCTIAIVAIATVLRILGRRNRHYEQDDDMEDQQEAETPESKVKTSVRKLISAIGIAVYLIVSFATGAWHITWLLFPLMGAVSGLVIACMDLKEAKNHEN